MQESASHTHGWGAAWWRTSFGLIVGIELLSALNLLQLQPTFTDIGLLITVSVVWLVVEYVRRFLPAHALLLVLLCILLDAVGDYLHWYQIFPNYDSYLHFLLPATIAYVCWLWIRGVWGAKIPTTFMLALSATLSISIGVVYELEEYLEDVLTTSHRFGNSFDTGNDLLMNTLGALTVTGILYVLERRRAQLPLQKNKKA